MPTTIIGGNMEDSQGRVLHPATEAKFVSTEDGKSVETKIAELLAEFGKYLPLASGGTVTGPINIDGGCMGINMWAQVSAGSDGFVLLANNAYKSQADNKYYFANTHDNIGARGIEFKYGQPGVWWFDTGNIATTAGQEFTPEWKSLTAPEAPLISGQDLNNLTANGHYCGQNLSNAPFSSTDWWYVSVQHLTDNSTAYVTQTAIAVNQNAVYTRTRRNNEWQPWERLATITSGGGASYIPIPIGGPGSGRGGYVGFPDSSVNLYLTNERQGGYINLSAPGGVYVNGTKVQTQHISTSAPNNSQGADGDTWDVYV